MQKAARENCSKNSCEFDCNEWNRLPNSQLFAVIMIFKVKSSLGIPARHSIRDQNDEHDGTS